MTSASWTSAVGGISGRLQGSRPISDGMTPLSLACSRKLGDRGCRGMGPAWPTANCEDITRNHRCRVWLKDRRTATDRAGRCRLCVMAAMLVQQATTEKLKKTLRVIFGKMGHFRNNQYLRHRYLQNIDARCKISVNTTPQNLRFRCTRWRTAVRYKGRAKIHRASSARSLGIQLL